MPYEEAARHKCGLSRGAEQPEHFGMQGTAGVFEKRVCCILVEPLKVLFCFDFILGPDVQEVRAKENPGDTPRIAEGSLSGRTKPIV
jgi:hypothetical protein